MNEPAVKIQRTQHKRSKVSRVVIAKERMNRWRYLSILRILYCVYFDQPRDARISKKNTQALLIRGMAPEVNCKHGERPA